MWQRCHIHIEPSPHQHQRGRHAPCSLHHVHPRFDSRAEPCHYMFVPRLMPYSPCSRLTAPLRSTPRIQNLDARPTNGPKQNPSPPKQLEAVASAHSRVGRDIHALRLHLPRYVFMLQQCTIPRIRRCKCAHGPELSQPLTLLFAYRAYRSLYVH